MARHVYPDAFAMKKLLRWIVCIVLGLLALPLIFFAVLLAANWRDEPLTPEAARLLAPPPAPQSDAANAYHVLLGLNAPDGEDALAAGRRIRAEFERRLRENPNAASDDPPRNETIVLEQEQWDEALACREPDCVDFYLGEQDRIRAFMAKRLLLRQRYRQFVQIPVLDEPLQRSVVGPSPRYLALLPASEMRRAEAVLALSGGDLQAGANILMEEIRAHRRLLAGSTHLMGKIMGVGLLSRDYQLLSEAIERWPQLAQQPALAEAWQPLRPEEYGMRKMIESEAAAQANTAYWLLQSQDGRKLVKSWGYLPNATVNLIARWAAEDVQNTEGAVAVDVRQASIARRKEEREQMASWVSWRSIRNPSGRMLVSALSGRPTWVHEVNGNLHNLDGYIRLIALQAALRRDDVPLAQVADYVERASPELRNPYSGQPMRWDAATATLSFEGRKTENLDNPDGEPKVYSVGLKFGQARGN